jgi:hypothetical protein
MHYATILSNLGSRDRFLHFCTTLPVAAILLPTRLCSQSVRDLID